MTLQLNVPKLACSACVNTITTAIQKVDANATVKADTKTKIISVETQASETSIKDAIHSVGYSYGSQLH
jgi:copper chaperone